MTRYLCDQCTHYWTTDEPVTACPECGNPLTPDEPPITDTLAVQVLARMLDGAMADVERRDDLIAAHVAMIDQLRAELETRAEHEREAWREVERLRRLCRRAGIAYTTSDLGRQIEVVR